MPGLHQKADPNQDYEHLSYSATNPNSRRTTSSIQTFLDRRNDFEHLIKVDADLVLISDQLFEGIVRKLSSNTWLEVMPSGYWIFLRR